MSRLVDGRRWDPLTVGHGRIGWLIAVGWRYGSGNEANEGIYNRDHVQSFGDEHGRCLGDWFASQGGAHRRGAQAYRLGEVERTDAADRKLVGEKDGIEANAHRRNRPQPAWTRDRPSALDVLERCRRETSQASPDRSKGIKLLHRWEARATQLAQVRAMQFYRPDGVCDRSDQVRALSGASLSPRRGRLANDPDHLGESQVDRDTGLRRGLAEREPQPVKGAEDPRGADHGRTRISPSSVHLSGHMAKFPPAIGAFRRERTAVRYSDDRATRSGE